MQRARELTDGEWHRLHPATPLLRGGLALIVAGGILFNSFRDNIIGLFLPEELQYEEYDPIVEAWNSGAFGWIALGAIAAIVLCIVGFWLAWRVHTFRITGDVVEVRQGLIFRKHRRAPLARIQGINIVKPWFARLFGACKLEVQQAGADSNVDLAYLSTSIADALRYEILGRSAGRSQAQRDAEADARGQAGQQGVVDDFLRPDAELEGLAPTSLVRIPTGRIILSSILESGIILWLPLVGLAAFFIVTFTDEWIILLTLIPAAIASVGYGIRALGQKLRYSIASTRDGIRLAYGLASSTTEILPPGRVFSMTVSQPLSWRPFGWWKVAFTRAGKADASGNTQAQNQASLLLPVGDAKDVETVLRLVLPQLAGSPLLLAGMTGSGPDGFVISPPRARAFRWFSRRRNGLAITEDAFLLRTGAIWRSLAVVPLARTQSFAMQQGPIYGMARLAKLVVHVVGGTLSPSIGALDADDVQRAFAYATQTVPQAIGHDSAESWGVGGEAAVDPGAPASPAPGSPALAPAPAAPAPAEQHGGAPFAPPVAPPVTRPSDGALFAAPEQQSWSNPQVHVRPPVPQQPHQSQQPVQQQQPQQPQQHLDPPAPPVPPSGGHGR